MDRMDPLSLRSGSVASSDHSFDVTTPAWAGRSSIGGSAQRYSISMSAGRAGSISHTKKDGYMVLTLGEHEYQFSVPDELRFLVLQVREQFQQKLAASTTVLSSKLDLVTSFLEFNAKEMSEARGAARQSREQLLAILLDDFESENDIHVFAAESAPQDSQMQKKIIRSYYAACAASRRPEAPRKSALLNAAIHGEAKIYATLGGQGVTATYMDELRDLFTNYNHYVSEFILSLGDILEELSVDPEVSRLYIHGIHIRKWLMEPSLVPNAEYMTSAPVSFPIIGVVQLAHYWVTLKVLGLNPGQFQDSLSGLAGHSQGVVIAAVMSGANTWASLIDLSRTAIKILLSIGARAQQSYPTISLDPAVIQESIDMGQGAPTSMLSVKGASLSELQKLVDATNRHLPDDERIAIGLHNGARNFIVSGPPPSLHGFNVRIRDLKAGDDNQGRIPYKERKLPIKNRFLAISAPFHGQHMRHALEMVAMDLQGSVLMSDKLRVPVYDTHTGEDMSLLKGRNIVPSLVHQIMVEPVHWEKCTVFEGATHIIDFGPGEASSLATMTNGNKEGTGCRTILACAIAGMKTELGYKSEIFDQNEESIVYTQAWVKKYAPRLVKTSSGQTFVDTKMSRLLGLPPIMVAGMTPTTVAWEFVAATINAGYHVELAGGGYPGAAAMTAALKKVVEAVPQGRGITVNLIYANARAMKWQVPLLERLRISGIPIDGLTIGAGVPSSEVTQGYIHNLGLKHISFKPGSISAIEAVIEVAQANPTFPIICQWTGGRAGGHHSCEDFHAPMLEMYGKIRACSNIILVAGSGFGSHEDIYPYITGAWSTSYGYPGMPYDGALFGSRMMTAKEAHTSAAAKQAIVDADGLDDSHWDKTYKGAAGGIITVISEMGEPIHMLATRGVKLWAEMDNIFKMDKAKKMTALKAKSKYIIQKLNGDYQRPYFGMTKTGKTVELREMTYYEIMVRLVDLMYIKTESRWIDKTLMTLMGDFIRRTEERFVGTSGKASALEDYAELHDPYYVVERIATAYPQVHETLITALDAQYFLQLTLRGGQKPVPFVPIIDEHFETYFKKDSLWQSEDLAAVVDQDVERTCVLQGPLAAMYAKKMDEPIKDILDSINNGLIETLNKDLYEATFQNIPWLEYFGGEAKEIDMSLFGKRIAVNYAPDSITYTISDSPNVELPPKDAWFEILMGEQQSWRRALFSSEYIPLRSKLSPNAMRSICTPTKGLSVTIKNYMDPSRASMIIKEKSRSDSATKAEVTLAGGNTVNVTLLHQPNSRSTKLMKLVTRFAYKPETGYAPIREIDENRVEDISKFYGTLWFEGEKLDFNQSITDVFPGGSTTITKESIADFIYALKNHNKAYLDRPGKITHAPLDYAIVLGWKALLRPAFLKAVGGDILNLVHLSNTFRRVPGAEMLKVGDSVDATSRVASLLIQDSGKVVKVHATITKDGKPVLEAISSFMYRGTYTDFENTFERVEEKPTQVILATEKDVAILQSKEWFQLESDSTELLGKTLVFHPSTFLQYKAKGVYSNVQISGKIEVIKNDQHLEIGKIVYSAGESHGNPVAHYLKRHGQVIEKVTVFPAKIALHDEGEACLVTPHSASLYAHTSGDLNPIHTSSIFASMAHLPSEIHHGMYTSGAVRTLLEEWVAKGDATLVHTFSASFVGMVLPGDEIECDFWHIGMVDGRRIIKVEAKNKLTRAPVLTGEAEVAMPRSAYIFTGQGSQEQGMGMDLYETSPAARAVWDRADHYYSSTFGFSIVDIIRRNPKELTVHFGGVNGRRIRQNYLNITHQKIGPDGIARTAPVFETITETSQSHTYRSPTGVLFSTQFTQPAICMVEFARIKDMESKGLLPTDCMFAGHSLGEFPALTSFANIMTIENMCVNLFYRGMIMQVAVNRDDKGASNFAMCAINPSRVSKYLDDAGLSYVVDQVARDTGMLLEIVNWNVSSRQYVCAGELRAQDCLSAVLKYISQHKEITFSWLKNPTSTPAAAAETYFLAVIHKYSTSSSIKPSPLVLERDVGFVPLPGVDVPFHSTFLRKGIDSFRALLRTQIDPVNAKPEILVGRYIPNLMGKPFSLEKEYVEECYRMTGSKALQKVLENWQPAAIAA